MSTFLNLSKMSCAVKGEKLEHGIFVGIALILASAAISGEMLEIITGLIGALCIYVMKERSSKRRACVDKNDKTPPWKSHDVRPNSVGDHKKVKTVETRVCKSRAVPVYEIIPPLHHAEPRSQLTVADGLPLCEQVDHLLQDILPGKVDSSVCEELARLASPPITKLIPEAKIDVIAHNSVVRIGRTGLRPEVDLLITVPPKVLAQRLLIHMREHAGDHSVRKLDKIMEVDENTLNKFAIRAVSAQLSFCKLWRTAYRGVEPKVVLLAPRCLGVLSEDIHVHVYVNCPNTIRSKEVFNQADSHVQKFIAFVRRWAQDRCIANTTYGHLPLYAWSLLAKYFCQSQEEHHFKTPTIELFGAFVDFNIKWLDSFSQSPAGSALQIADPFDPDQNVADCMTPTGLKRFREELERAKTLLANKASLLTIMEHCNPLPQGSKDAPDSDVHKRQRSIVVASLKKSPNADSSIGEEMLKNDGDCAESTYQDS